RGHVEIHDVADIVAIHEQNAGAAGDRLHALENRIGRRRREDVADRDGVSEALADVAEKAGLVARPAADHETDLALTRPVQRHERAPRESERPYVGAMGADGAVEHLLDHVIGLVDELLDVFPWLSAAVPHRLPVVRSSIELDAAVGPEHAPRR